MITETRTIEQFLKTTIPKNKIWRVSSEDRDFSYRYWTEEDAREAFLEYRDDEDVEDVVCYDEDYNEVHHEW